MSARTPSLVVVGGGVRSGKSRYALERARAMAGRRVFVATAQALDEEMRLRIDAHRTERQGEFETHEAPLELAATLQAARPFDVAVVDCLTLWLSNRLLHDGDPDRVRAHIEDLVDVLPQLGAPVIVVTNEVGMGVVPPSALGRQFRDLAGFAHQRLAACCNELLFAAMGVVLELRPGPIRCVWPPLEAPTIDD